MRPIDSLRIDGQELDAQLIGSVTSGKLIRTMSGTPSVELRVFDPDRRLLKSGALIRPNAKPLGKDFKSAAWDRIGKVQLTIEGFYFRLAGVAKDGDYLTITFEGQIAALLRRHTRPLKQSRAEASRAAFVHVMTSEVDEITIPTVMTDPNKRQPIYSVEGETKRDRARTRREKERAEREEILGQKGLSKDADITIKGAAATDAQRAEIETCMRVAGELNASKRPILAMLVAGIGESEFKPVANTAGSGYAGVFQAHPRNIARTDTEKQCRHFFKGGLGFQAGGAIALAKANPSMSPGTIATKVEASGKPGSFYDAHRKEADKILEAYEGGDPDADYTLTTTTRRTYYFRRGGPNGEREDSWEATGRLAEEVGWRRFESGNIFYFVNDEFLFRAKPRLTLTERSQGVVDIDFDVDYGKPVSTVTINARSELFVVPPGSVVALDELGPVNGRWLVEEVTTDLFTAECTIELRRPSPDKPEPAPETSTRTITIPVGGDEDAVPGSRGLVYPLAVHGKNIGGVAAHLARAWGNWQSDNAVDIGVKQGVPVVAVADGTITGLGGSWQGGGSNPDGFHVTLKTKNNEWFYTHLRSRTNLKIGQKVKAGEKLGVSGAANGVPHLHIGVRTGDPVKLLRV